MDGDIIESLQGRYVYVYVITIILYPEALGIISSRVMVLLFHKFYTGLED